MSQILNVRYDWHQQEDHVCISIFAKNAIKETFKMSANDIYLTLEVEYEAGLAKLGK